MSSPCPCPARSWPPRSSWRSPWRLSRAGSAGGDDPRAGGGAPPTSATPTPGSPRLPGAVRRRHADDRRDGAATFCDPGRPLGRGRGRARRTRLTATEGVRRRAERPGGPAGVRDIAHEFGCAWTTRYRRRHGRGSSPRPSPPRSARSAGEGREPAPGRAARPSARRPRPSGSRRSPRGRAGPRAAGRVVLPRTLRRRVGDLSRGWPSGAPAAAPRSTLVERPRRAVVRRSAGRRGLA